MDNKGIHVGIILDGNRRYAKKVGLPQLKGHEEGAKRVKEIIEESIRLKIKELTLYTFSLENFKRTKTEVGFLMKLFKKSFNEFMKKAENEKQLKKARIVFAGDKSLFSKDIRNMMNYVEKKTEKNSGIIINFAMGYGGRSEIVNAVKKIVKKEIRPEKINEKTISENLYVKNDVDLIIRTSGEKRISGFLPWQGVYAELIFLDKLWPEFTKDDLKSCIEEFNNRKRRFGK
jgi:undecaprenyl diphosphate synthase